MITLRKMNDEEYLRFREYSIADYAKDLMNGENLPEEKALADAADEFSDMLPDGQDTEDQFLMIIEDRESKKEAGWIWFCYEDGDDGSMQVFLNDFLIYEESRRQGYATAALREMEKKAKADGCKASVLFVWDHNPAGISLYRECGYVPGAREEGGAYMKKKL